MVFKPKTKQHNHKNGVLQKYVLTRLNTQVTVSLMNNFIGIRTRRALPFRRTLPLHEIGNFLPSMAASMVADGELFSNSF